jgi:hypothetical protein
MNQSLAPTVRFAEDTPNGLAVMLGDLIGQNLARDPRRTRLLRPSVSSIEAPDAGVAVTITMSPTQVSLANGVGANTTVRVRASSDRLIALVAAPLRFGLPDPLHAEGRAVVTGLIRGQIRVRGLVRHPRQVARLTMLLSAQETRS